MGSGIGSGGDPRANVSGIIAMLLSCIFFVVGDCMIKVVGASLPLGEMLIIRGALSVPFVIAAAAYAGKLEGIGELLTNPMLWLRTVLEIATVMLFLISILNMPYAAGVSVQQSNPLVMMAAAALLLGERVGWRRWLAAIIGFIGVLIIIRPGTPSFGWPAFTMIGSVVAMVLRDLVTRRLGPGIASLQLTVVAVISVGLSGLLLWPFEQWVAPSMDGLALLAVAAVGSMGGIHWMIKAVRTGDVSVVIPFRYSLIPFGVVAGIVGFAEWPDMVALAGMAIVIGAGLFALHRERVAALEGAAS
jgi:drug/metabolite transporter (DMT)-like permease